MYGGFGLAIAAVLVYASRAPEARTGVLITVGVALAGMAVGRVVSVFDGRTPFYPNWFYCLVEAVAAAALFALQAAGPGGGRRAGPAARGAARVRATG